MSNAIKSALFDQCQRTYAYNQIRIDDNSHRYQESWLYFLGKRPLNLEIPTEEQIRKGEDVPMEYVEPVVRNAVTALTPQVLDIFTENDESAVVFRDRGFHKNLVLEEIINNVINGAILRENDGYRVLENALKEALVSGDSFSKIFIDEKYEEDKIELTNWSNLEEVISTLAESGWKFDVPVELIDNPKKGTSGSLSWRTNVLPPALDNPQPLEIIEIMGTLRIYKVDKKLAIENVGLRDLVIDTTCGDDFSKCRYICHKMKMTVGEAVDLGYKASALKSASSVNDYEDAPYNKFNLVSNAQIGISDMSYDDNGDELERMITIYEHYIYSSIPSKGKKSKLYQVHATDAELLDYQEITIMPFVHGQVDTIPESFWGRSCYDIFAPYQDNESKMQRLAYKNAFNATYNKVLVTKNQYNAESLINSNKPGAIIEQNVAGAIQPWPYQDLPASYGVAVQKLTESKRQTLGTMVGNVTTEDGVSGNMAAQTVAMILSQERMKSKVVAKTFARTYVRPMFEKIYEVYRNNGMSVKVPAGTKFRSVPEALPEDVTITSDQFPEVYSFEVDINTNGDTAIENQQLVNTLGLITSVQTNSIADPSSLYKIAGKLLDSVNLSIEDYFKNPADTKLTPEQAEQMAIQNEAQKLQLQKLIAEITKITSETALNEAKITSETQSNLVDNQIKMSTSLADIQAKQAKAINDAKKTVIDAAAVQAEIASGENVAIPELPRINLQANGVRM